MNAVAPDQTHQQGGVGETIGHVAKQPEGQVGQQDENKHQSDRHGRDHPGRAKEERQAIHGVDLHQQKRRTQKEEVSMVGAEACKAHPVGAQDDDGGQGHGQHGHEVGEWDAFAGQVKEWPVIRGQGRDLRRARSRRRRPFLDRLRQVGPPVAVLSDGNISVDCGLKQRLHACNEPWTKAGGRDGKVPPGS